MVSEPRNDVHVLLVEDNPGDIDLVKDALARFSSRPTLEVATDGSRALALLLSGERKRLPDLILLDLNVPKTDGREVLAAIRADERTTHIPVIVLSSSNAERDLMQAYRLHANCFITKPADIDAFFRMFELIEQFWLKLVKLPAPVTT